MQTELLKVAGMTCGGCISNVTHALRAINGVGDVKVSLSAGQATVRYDERLTSPDKLKSAVKGAGYGVDLQHRSETSIQERLLRLTRIGKNKAQNGMDTNSAELPCARFDALRADSACNRSGPTN